MSNSAERHIVRDIIARCERILGAAGARGDIARCVAEVLVEGEILGHDTHGLALLAPYVRQLQANEMAGDGQWDVTKSTFSTQLWNGNRLPGPWLVKNALAVASRNARECGLGMVSVGRSHHIACLAAYLEQPAREGLIAIIQSSDPSAAGVAPFGGTQAVISPNPIAAGVPTKSLPILIDVSTSITTFGLAMRTAAQGNRLPGKWLLNATGHATDEPSVLDDAPPGTLLPLGGTESGHKGFGLGLLVDVLTGSLSGHGRTKRPTEWGASFLVIVIDPDAFCGLDQFVEETSHLVEISHASRPVDECKPVRLPGERGLSRKSDALVDGMTLAPHIELSLDDLEIRLGLQADKP